MRFENFPLPDRTPSGNVRIEIKAVGICGSDVHYWRKVGTLALAVPLAKALVTACVFSTGRKLVL